MIGEEIGYIDMAERDGSTDQITSGEGGEWGIVDVVLSDMSEPWPQTEGFWKNYLTEAYFRMMNVSGIRVKDHGDSMVYPLLFWSRDIWGWGFWVELMVGLVRCGDVVCGGCIEKSGVVVDEILYWCGGQGSRGEIKESIRESQEGEA